MERAKYEGPIWVAQLNDGETEWQDDMWYGDYDDYMNWIDMRGYDVADVWQVDESGKRLD